MCYFKMCTLPSLHGDGSTILMQQGWVAGPPPDFGWKTYLLLFNIVKLPIGYKRAVRTPRLRSGCEGIDRPKPLGCVHVPAA